MTRKNCPPASRPPAAAPRRPAPRHAAPDPAFCVVGETLCRVRVYPEAEWDALPADRRPTPAEHFPGLGWVAAVPAARLG